MIKSLIIVSLYNILFCAGLYAQTDSVRARSSRNGNNQATAITDSSRQKDMIDVIHRLFHEKENPEHQSPKKVNLSLVPSIGYTLSTGFAAGVSGVATFYTQPNHNKTNISVVNAQLFFDTNNQQTFFAQSNIFTGYDNYKFITDLRLAKYPDVTYGLGSSTTQTQADPVDYNYIRVYQTVLKKLLPNYYAGIGYNLDRHFNIVEFGQQDGKTTAFERYGKTETSTSSGLSLNMLFDNRQNPVNALGGAYANIVYRFNSKILGSNSQWSSLIIDARKYFKLSSRNNNVLAFWSYIWITLDGKQPYLDLPTVGADTYNNTGRGYPIDRFRGKNMLYLESEYRFGLTRNGLLGGVVFANAQNYSKNIDAGLARIIPAAGTGIRIKINKHSDTNLCIDYAIGTDHSRGFFVNLGEVF